MKTKLTGKLILPLLLLTSLPNFAQQGRGTILGTVTDASGAPVAGAVIKVTNTATNSGLELCRVPVARSWAGWSAARVEVLICLSIWSLWKFLKSGVTYHIAATIAASYT